MTFGTWLFEKITGTPSDKEVVGAISATQWRTAFRIVQVINDKRVKTWRTGTVLEVIDAQKVQQVIERLGKEVQIKTAKLMDLYDPEKDVELIETNREIREGEVREYAQDCFEELGDDWGEEEIVFYKATGNGGWKRKKQKQKKQRWWFGEREPEPVPI